MVLPCIHRCNTRCQHRPLPAPFNNKRQNRLEQEEPNFNDTQETIDNKSPTRDKVQCFLSSVLRPARRLRTAHTQSPPFHTLQQHKAHDKVTQAPKTHNEIINHHSIPTLPPHHAAPTLDSSSLSTEKKKKQTQYEQHPVTQYTTHTSRRNFNRNYDDRKHKSNGVFCVVGRCDTCQSAPMHCANTNVPLKLTTESTKTNQNYPLPHLTKPKEA